MPRSTLEQNLQMHIKKNKIHLSWELPGSDRRSEMKASDWKKEVVNMKLIGSLIEDPLTTTWDFS